MKAIPTKTPNKREHRVPAGHLWSPNEDFSTRIGLYLIDLLAKGVPHGYHKKPRLWPRLYVALYKLTPGPIAEDNMCITHGTWRSRAGTYTEPFSLLFSVLDTYQDILNSTKGD